MKKILIVCLLTIVGSTTAQINRKAVVTRNNPVVTTADSLESLSVGNGHFAVTVDITGLQSFPSHYKNGIPLCAMSDWGWHTFPNVEQFKPEETLKVVDTGNGHPSALYAVEFKNKNGKEARQKAATDYFRANPHRLNLGETGMEFYDAQHRRISINGIKHSIQSLNLWTGRIYSMYNVCNEGVVVQTAVHPDKDCEMFKIESHLLKTGQISIALRFPYPSGKHSDDGADWTKPSLHQTEIVKQETGSALIKRTIDNTLYYILLKWDGEAKLTADGPHLIRLTPTKNNNGVLQVTEEYLCGAPVPYGKTEKDISLDNATDYTAGIAETTEHWKKFWNTGAIADFSACTDSRAKELERRIVLSQYLTAINCANNMSPQESGLTYNTWFGRPHLEMTWWHTLDFSLWNHPEYLEKIMSWYDIAFDKAKEIAQRQGYKGVRWMKMTDPWVGESPSGIGSFLIWQQPHYIYLAEELYRRHPANGILDRYADKVFATADFMADFVTYDSISKKYIIKGATAMQETRDWKTTYNQPFDMQYWRYGLQTAQKWRERMGMQHNELWDKIINGMAPLPEKNGIYTAGIPSGIEDSLFLAKSKSDHPAVLGAYGLLPDYGNIDREKMTKTYLWVEANWNWMTTWGWDYGMTAMTAARLGMQNKAVDALLLNTQKNTYLKNGHNYQDNRLRVYLPGNGALLTAAAMMMAGWDGSPNIKNPGFPQDGKWNVKWEGINRMQ